VGPEVGLAGARDGGKAGRAGLSHD
jgi:hypothetical protein